MYIYLRQDNDQFVSKAKNNNKEKGNLQQKGLASIIANTVNIIKGATAK